MINPFYTQTHRGVV